MADKLKTNGALWDFEGFRKEGGLARGLPGFAYSDQAFWRHETESLFQSSWVFAGFVHELSRPGDVVPVAVGGRPVVLVRDKQGTIRAFHNVCRHRCLKLVDKPGNAGAMIRCPYHAWSYSFDGQLRATPYFGGPENRPPDGFAAENHGLRPVRSAIWHDWIFVNLDGAAAELSDYVAPLARRMEGIDFAKLVPVATLDFGEVRTNWKFLMENFIEPYHVQFVHKTTTDQPLLDHYTVVDGPCVGSAVDITKSKNDARVQQNALAVTSRYLTLFPNFIIGVYEPDQIGVYLNVPLDAERTLQKRAIYTLNGKGLSDPEAEALKSLWWAVHKEDHEMCERLQEGRRSEVSADGGVLSPHWENSVRCFQQLVVDAVTR
ncbi:MAG: aromatic ring-hydroxylating dioxygenase subunit alpha [Pseudomonadota bacterium]